MAVLSRLGNRNILRAPLVLLRKKCARLITLMKVHYFDSGDTDE